MTNKRASNFNADKGFKYFTKAEKRRYGVTDEPEEMNPREAIVARFLHNEAIKVLQHTAKALTVNHLDSARKLLELLDE